MATGRGIICLNIRRGDESTAITRTFEGITYEEYANRLVKAQTRAAACEADESIAIIAHISFDDSRPAKA